MKNNWNLHGPGDSDEFRATLEQCGSSANPLDVIINTVESVVIVLDTKGKIVLLNRTGQELTGYSFDEVRNREFWDIFLLPEERPEVERVFEQLTTGMFPSRHENYWRTKSGDSVLLAWTNTALVNDRGEVEFVVGAGVDVTDAREAENRIKEREVHFRLVADYTYDLEYWHDPQGRLIYISPSCRRITGYDREEFLADPKLLLKIIHPEDQELYQNHLKEVASPDAPPLEARFRIFHKNGEVRWITHGCQSVFNDEGVWLGRRASNRDDTQRTLAEKARTVSDREVQRKNAVLTAINRIFRETPACETEADVARVCLREAEDLIGGSFGFIGEINKDGLIGAVALSDPGWNACRVARDQARALIKHMAVDGVWGRILETGESAVVNGTDAHPLSFNLPQGHPPLASLLGVPLKRQDNVLGLVALANKNQGYTEEDREVLENLALTFSELLRRKKTEIQLDLERRQLLSIFDAINDLVYVADPETFELLYANQAVLDVFGDIVGQKCHRALQNLEEQCEFCTNDRIFGENVGQPYIWEFYNQKIDRWYRIMDKAIKWPDGRAVRFELAVDITDSKRAEEATRRSAVSRQLVGQMFRDIQQLAGLLDGDLFKAGWELSRRVESEGVEGKLDAYNSLGLGELRLEETSSDARRWIFSGDDLVESSVRSNQPTGSYTRGFLCGVVSAAIGSPKVAGVETACQSMGDELCRFVVQALA